MHTELVISESTLFAFALVLSRVLGIFVFIPMPVSEAGPGVARIAIALASTIALYPRWPSLQTRDIGIGTLCIWLLAEVGLGTAVGLMVSFVSESITFGARILALQAGYGYASVVDPTTQADSDVLPVLAQLTAGLLFFTTGLHRSIIAAFATSLDSFPPGSFTLSRDLASTVIRLGSNVFLIGLRLASPVIALLLMVDIAMALLGRLSTQLHLSHHAFSIKMLIALIALATVFTVAPTLYESFSSEAFRQIQSSFRR